MNDLILKARGFANEVHTAACCKYGEDNQPYMIHLTSVHEWMCDHEECFKEYKDSLHTRAAAFTHDTIEDAQQSYNDVKRATNKQVADITLAVTDVHAENRMLRFLLTVPKIIRDHRALILKICDIGANGSYSKRVRSSMYKKYQKEWAGYKRNIFVSASRWYEKELNLDKFDRLIEEVDKVLDYTSE